MNSLSAIYYMIVLAYVEVESRSGWSNFDIFTLEANFGVMDLRPKDSVTKAEVSALILDTLAVISVAILTQHHAKLEFYRDKQMERSMSFQDLHSNNKPPIPSIQRPKPVHPSPLLQ